MNFLKKLFTKEFYTKKVLIILAVSVLSLAVCISLVVLYSCDSNKQGGEDQTSKVESTTDNKETTDKSDDTTGETPDDTTGETPDETTGETPDDTTGTTPDDTTGTTPDDTTGRPTVDTTGRPTVDTTGRPTVDTTGGSQQPITPTMQTYNVTVSKGAGLGTVNASAVRSEGNGTLYEITVSPKTGYLVAGIKVGNSTLSVSNNKATCVLTGDASVEITYSRKTNAELEARRNTVLSKMQQITGTQFRYDRDYTDYSLGSKTVSIDSSKLYQGMPYSNVPTVSFDAFFDFVIRKDPDGVYVVGDIMGNANRKYIWGNNCADAVYGSWATISTTMKCTISYDFTQRYGIEYVGDYVIEKADLDLLGRLKEDRTINTTKNICNKNGKNTMYEAYALLTKGDGAVTLNKASGHVIMIGSVNVVRDSNGAIDGARSYIRYYDQNAGYKEKSGVNGQTVMSSCAYNEKMTFNAMAYDGYIPVTCKELIDESYAIPQAYVKDSLNSSQYNLANLTQGNIDSNYYMLKVKMEITDASGNVVYSGIRYRDESRVRGVLMNWFTQDALATYPNDPVYKDKLDINSFASGNYHCKVTAYLTNGYEQVVRDFDFTK